MTSISDRPDAARPLAGVRIVEISSFVAVPLAGMTLAQLGAEVIRVDPVGGAADYHRWPLTADGESIYWAGLNKGKLSAAIDVRSAEGQELIVRLIGESGILITNVAGRQWHSYEALVAARPDLIHVEVSGRADGGTGVDYTVNAGIGFPLVTGPVDVAEPVNHVLPAWDVTCGLYVALAVTAALRHRDATGEGQRIGIPLENVALATAGNLSFLTEVMVNGVARERIGNSIFGQYGQAFISSDGASFMVVALTGRHFRDLAEVTGTTKATAALGDALGADFTDEGQRYRHRDALTGLVHRVVHRSHRRRDHRGIVGDLHPLGALPHLRRRRGQSEGDRESVVQPAGPAADRRVSGRRSAAGSQRRLPAGGSRARVGRPHRRGAPRKARPLRCRHHSTDRRGNRGVSTLLRLLDVRPGPSDDVWLGPASGPEGKRSFGGQFMAQTLAAASRTVEPMKLPTSMHLQFLRGGEAGDGVEYSVQKVYDGRTASSRRVESRQGGRLITAASVSFAMPLAGPEHGRYATMPQDPETLPRTGPVGPAPSIPLGEIDIRVEDDRDRTASSSDGCGGGSKVPIPPTTRCCTTVIAAYVTDVYMIDPGACRCTVTR